VTWSPLHSSVNWLVFYIYSLYGYVLWNVCNVYVECVCHRLGICRVWGLPSNAHSVFLPLLCCRLPLYDELMKRLLTFTQRRINSDNNLVTFVVRYAIWYGRMASPLGCSVIQCCSKCDIEYKDCHFATSIFKDTTGRWLVMKML